MQYRHRGFLAGRTGCIWQGDSAGQTGEVGRPTRLCLQKLLDHFAEPRAVPQHVDTCLEQGRLRLGKCALSDQLAVVQCFLHKLIMLVLLLVPVVLSGSSAVHQA